MRLNMLKPDAETPEIFFNLEPYSFKEYSDWLQLMLDRHPNVIWFYTIDSTDIWDDQHDEMDYNTVLYSVGVELRHTYDPKCPQGCTGLMAGCRYKNKELDSD